MENLTGHFGDWIAVGPFQMAGALDPWTEMVIDGATEIPHAIEELNGQKIFAKKLAPPSPLLDFNAVFEKAGGTPQSYAFVELETPSEGSLSIVYDADWSAVWWIDGKEVFATRTGNRGCVGQMKHRFVSVLEKGRHLISVRVISGTGGWSLFVHSMDWNIEIPDELRCGRDALWRNYSNALVRHENRPLPDGNCGGVSKEAFELLTANMGVEARWIGVAHHHMGSYFPSTHLPLWPGATSEHERQLHAWVDELHKRRICAMSWLPLSENEAAWNAYPDWRQEYLVPPSPGALHGNRMCCINSPYGEALIEYAVEAIERFDLDGIWFDGSNFSTCHVRPLPVSCVCPHCRRKFNLETGLEVPMEIDWSKPAFRSWVKWRYDMFGGYWQRLVDRIHAKFPSASVAFNHYHREGVGWSGAVPLNPFGHDFVSATEADGEPLRGAFYTKCMRAYGRGGSEVWMGLGGTRQITARGPICNPRKAMDFTLACATSGGHASTGGGDASVEIPVLGRLSDALKPRAPYLNLPSVPYAALHLSQQSETFVFGRDPDYTGRWTDFYWNSLVGWHHALAFSGLTSDVIYDSHIDDLSFTKYPLVIMPLAPSLKKSQFDTIVSYVKSGGVLVTGPWFGVCDEVGEDLTSPLGDRTPFPFGSKFPSWSRIAERPELEFGTSSGSVKCRPLSALPPDLERIDIANGIDASVLNVITFGKGWIVQFAFDVGGVYRRTELRDIVVLLHKLIRSLATPLFEFDGAEGLLGGIFKKDADTMAIHIQQFSAPWMKESSDSPSPRTLWDCSLIWNGLKPSSVRCALPEIGAELPFVRKGDAWIIKLPPFSWGQIVLVKI